jgi:hypothetical protein
MANAQQIVLASMRQEKSQPARAAEPSSGSVHRMVIVEGPNRRVHYIASGKLSESDSMAAYNLERAENELAYLRDLQELKQQYVRSERTLEPHRRVVQLELYGRQTSSSSYASTYVNYNPYGAYGYPGGLYGYYGAGAPAMYSPFFYGYGGNRGGAYSSVSSSSSLERRGLQYGMGNEGSMKNAMVRVIAAQASPDYVAAAVKNYQAALKDAADSPILSRDLGLPKSQKSPPPPSSEKDSPKSVK